MLQEISEINVMEKKLIQRGAQASGKTSAQESKQRQDVVTSSNSNKCHRGGAGGGNRKWDNSTSKCEAKLAPFKKTSFQHRGNYSSESGGARHRNQIAHVEEAEVGSAARPGSKKLNLNHLLNFTYNSGKERNSPVFHGHRNVRSVWTTRVHKYNKEQFLQANCQFVVQEGHDYSVHSADPDLLVDWEWIEQVRVFSHELPSCPICLFPPLAAKITRCGHLYCWPCMLHYLALSDKEWRKCPICYEAVYKKHLKSVVAQAIHYYKAGDEIEMVLMHRERGSVIAVPHLMSSKNNGQLIQFKNSEQACFAKLVMATNAQVLEEIVNLEQNDLETAFEENKDCPEVCFIEDAIQQLQDRKEALFKKNNIINEFEGGDSKNVLGKTLIMDAEEFKAVNYSSAFDEMEDYHTDIVKNEVVDTDGDKTKEDAVSEVEKGKVIGSSGRKDRYYFYQSVDGQHIYLHAINAHMLIQEYGSLENCPDKIIATIVEKESISMNEDLRRRLRYLAHLPLTCDFEVVELQFTRSLISEDTLKAFSEEILKRKRKRNQRLREENKRERQLQAKEDQGIRKDARISLGSLKQFPECGPLNSSTEDQATEACLSRNSVSSDASSSPTSSSAGPSFAQMLRDGKAKLPVDVYPKAMITTEKAPYDTDSDEEKMFVPTFRDSFCAALQDALDNYPSSESAQNEVGGNQSKGGGGRKKKGKQNKQRLLFTTNVIRNK